MHAPITVNYVPDGGDWKVTVTDEEQTQNATASGLIAARDQADQIVEKMVPNQTGRTVVHLLEGDALAFTNSYLQVRLGLAPLGATPVPEPPPAAAPSEAGPAPEPQPDATPAVAATAATADLAAPDGTVPTQPTPDAPLATPASATPASATHAAATPASATQEPAPATTAEAPTAEVPDPQADVPTITPSRPDEADKDDQLTEVAGAPGNQVN